MRKDCSKLALGTVQFGLDYGINNREGVVKNPEIKKILKICKDAGVKIIDTARAYGESEKNLGSCNLIKDFKIVTKFSKIGECENSLKISLKNLNTDSVYGLLLHDFSNIEKNKKSWKKIESLRDKNLFKKLGFSVYYPEQVEFLFSNNIYFDILQFPYSVFDQRFRNILYKLKDRNIETHCRSAFLQGLVFKDFKNLDKLFLPAKSSLRKLNKLSNDLNIPISSICLCFCILNKNIDNVVIGVDNSENIKENILCLEHLEKIEYYYDILKSLKVEDLDTILPFRWNK